MKCPICDVEMEKADNDNLSCPICGEEKPSPKDQTIRGNSPATVQFSPGYRECSTSKLDAKIRKEAPSSNIKSFFSFHITWKEWIGSFVKIAIHDYRRFIKNDKIDKILLDSS